MHVCWLDHFSYSPVHTLQQGHSELLPSEKVTCSGRTKSFRGLLHLDYYNTEMSLFVSPEIVVSCSILNCGEDGCQYFTMERYPPAHIHTHTQKKKALNLMFQHQTVPLIWAAAAYRVICPAVSTGPLHLCPFICSHQAPRRHTDNNMKNKRHKCGIKTKRMRAVRMKSYCLSESKRTIRVLFLISCSSVRGLSPTEEVSVNMEGPVPSALTEYVGLLLAPRLDLKATGGSSCALIKIQEVNCN